MLKVTSSDVSCSSPPMTSVDAGEYHERTTEVSTLSLSNISIATVLLIALPRKQNKKTVIMGSRN